MKHNNGDLLHLLCYHKMQFDFSIKTCWAFGEGKLHLLLKKKDYKAYSIGITPSEWWKNIYFLYFPYYRTFKINNHIKICSVITTHEEWQDFYFFQASIFSAHLCPLKSIYFLKTLVGLLHVLCRITCKCKLQKHLQRTVPKQNGLSFLLIKFSTIVMSMKSEALASSCCFIVCGFHPCVHSIVQEGCQNSNFFIWFQETGKYDGIRNQGQMVCISFALFYFIFH